MGCCCGGISRCSSDLRCFDRGPGKIILIENKNEQVRSGLESIAARCELGFYTSAMEEIRSALLQLPISFMELTTQEKSNMSEARNRLENLKEDYESEDESYHAEEDDDDDDDMPIRG